MNRTDICAAHVDGVHGAISEAWSSGFMDGSLIILGFFVIANMKRGKWLHKLILLELVLAFFHGTFIFTSCPINGWYTSSTAVLLYLSYNVHNLVNWIKIKPFLPRWGTLLYFGTIVFVFPYWIAQMYLNFVYNNDLGNTHFRQTRPWEAIFREPWWIFTSFYLIYVIHRCYRFTIFQLVCLSSRFCMLMIAILLSVGFIITDIIDTAANTSYGGRNPFWKLALVFKCTADALFLDDFKTVLDSLSAHRVHYLTDEPAVPTIDQSGRSCSVPSFDGNV